MKQQNSGLNLRKIYETDNWALYEVLNK